MDQHTATAEPTLDHQRTDQLRTFLTVEAAADAASSSTHAHRPGRRLVAGVAAAVVLGAGLFAITSVAGGPDSGPAQVATANAVEIQQVEAGWTKISIADIDADPDAVVAELRAAGIEAERRPLDISRTEEGHPTLGSFDNEAHEGGGFTMLGGTGEAGAAGLAGLSISSPHANPSPPRSGLSDEEAEAELDAYLDELGARGGSVGSIEIRNDAGITVIVLTEG